MKENLLNHLISLFLRIDNEYILINENKTCKSHVIAINNIEQQLPKYGIHHYTKCNDILTEFAFYYASLGNILVGQMNNIFFIYLPEIIDELTEKTLLEIKSHLKDYELYIQKKEGENWVLFDIVEPKKRGLKFKI